MNSQITSFKAFVQQEATPKFFKPQPTHSPLQKLYIYILYFVGTTPRQEESNGSNFDGLIRGLLLGEGVGYKEVQGRQE